MEVMHPFTEKGLGNAPFVCVRIEKHPNEDGMCDYCGEHLVWCYIVREVNGKEFTLGCECVKKHDKELRKSLGILKRSYLLNEAKKRLANETIRKTLSEIPHVNGSKKTKLEWIEQAFSKWGYAKDRDTAIEFLLRMFP
jgi:hypothetical protein